MGHVNGSIYERSYRNQVVDADVISFLLGTPSDETTMKLIGHMLLGRDLNTPTEPTFAQRRQIRDDPEVDAAKRFLDASTKALRDRYGSVATAKRKVLDDPTVEIELQEDTWPGDNHDSVG